MRPRPTRIALCMLLSAGCAGGTVDVLTRADPMYDFDQHRTYRWASAAPTETMPANVVDPADLDSRIRAAVDASLSERGFHPSETPDLIVTYKVQAKGEIPEVVPSSPGRSEPSTPPSALGALVLDFQDASNSSSVWRGAAMTDVQQGEGRKHIQRAVDKVLEDFPPKR